MTTDCETALCNITDLCNKSPGVKQFFDQLAEEIGAVDNPEAGADDPCWAKARSIVEFHGGNLSESPDEGTTDMESLLENFVYLYFELGVDLQEIIAASQD